MYYVNFSRCNTLQLKKTIHLKNALKNCKTFTATGNHAAIGFYTFLPILNVE